MKRLDFFAHILLILGILIAGIAFWGLRYQGNAQILVIFTLVIFYIFWALVYHYTKRNLTRKLFLEYLLVAAICTVVGILVFYL